MNERKMLVAELFEMAGAKLVLATIVLAAICTCVTAQENTTASAPALKLTGVMASGGDEYVVIANDLSETENLMNWGLVIDGNQVALPQHPLEPSQSVKVHLGKGESSDADLFLNSNVKLSDTAGNIALNDDTGATVSSLDYKVQPDGSITYTTTAAGSSEGPKSAAS